MPAASLIASKPSFGTQIITKKINVSVPVGKKGEGETPQVFCTVILFSVLK